MTITYTNIMGGLGRVAIGADGLPARVVPCGPVVLVFNVPGVTLTETTSAHLLGPAVLTFNVPGLMGTVGPAVLTFNVPGVTRS